jgi:glycyl-tRNA synthetase beta chain
MSHEPLLLEIGCEEIPARMIRAAAHELARRVEKILDQATLKHGEISTWYGPRRIAVRVDEVEGSQTDREELVLGPPAAVAFAEDGQPARAALGFAKKQGVEAGDLGRHTTEKGEYVGFVRRVAGRTVGGVLAQNLPRAVEGMSFPKTMRWGAGSWRWVRPVHWVLALHGNELLELELFGTSSGRVSIGHRFLGRGPCELDHPDRYLELLEQNCVIADPSVRRQRLEQALSLSADELGGRVVADEGLLAEVADLVEWPGTAAGRFDEDFLSLPRELLVTTLRHHQKCFSLQSEDGALLPCFVAVANTDRDPRGHIRRGNEWVIGGRLEDARFFWNQDRKTPLADRSTALAGMVFHAAAGTYAEKATRLEQLAGKIATLLELAPEQVAACRQAGLLCKNDLVSDTVGEFPELQGQVGGLLLAAEGAGHTLAQAVYGHYRPAGSDDPIPGTPEGCVVSVADKLDTLSGIIAAGKRPTGSKDPFGLRRAGNAIPRILLEARWPICLRELLETVEADPGVSSFMRERLVGFFKERGFTINEIQAAIRPRVREDEVFSWPLPDLAARLEAIQAVRDRQDFRSLVKLTERVDTIVVKNEKLVNTMRRETGEPFEETSASGVELQKLVEELTPRMDELSRTATYDGIVQSLARFVDPVERYFTDVLVIDKQAPEATLRRYDLLAKLRELLTRYFDIRELAGQAERRSS